MILPRILRLIFGIFQLDPAIVEETSAYVTAVHRRWQGGRRGASPAQQASV
jgi:hypothetical protein